MKGRREAWLAACLIGLACLFVYAPVRDYPFVVYDDKEFVSENPRVREGLTRASLVWAFTASHSGNYVPLTWLSHMLDVELFGLAAGAHHAVNALLHLTASLLLFAWLNGATGAVWRSALATAAFAVHPLHVESVAWISERRDTLSALFWMLTLLAWTRYARRPSAGRYGLAAAALALGLLAKPMLASLPVILLLVDRWPLRRGETLGRRLGEKLPLLGLSLAASLAAIWAQRGGGALASLEQIPLASRLATAVTSSVTYLGHALWPLELAVFYPYDLAISGWRVAGSLLVLAGITAACLAWARRYPPLIVGWLWYLVALLPVSGIVQIGSQALADRYTYLPLIGVGIAVAWGGHAAAARAGARRVVSGAAALLVATWIGIARLQVETWRDSTALFGRALAISGPHPVIDLNLGEAHADAGRLAEARHHYERAVHSAPGHAGLRARLADVLARQGNRSAAIAQWRQAVRLDPESVEAHFRLGGEYLRIGRLEEANRELERVVSLEPGHPEALLHLGELAALEGRGELASQRMAEALRRAPDLEPRLLQPNEPATGAALAAALDRVGRHDDAVRQAERALALARFGDDAALSEALHEALRSYRARALPTEP